MALKTFVKINAVNNLSDARYCAGMGVDVMGFNVDPQSPGFITQDSFEEITGWVSGPKMALECGIETVGIEKYESDYLEAADLDVLQSITIEGKKQILKIDLLQVKEVYIKDIDFIHLEGTSEQLTQEEIAQIRDLAHNVQVILGYGFNAKNIEDILTETEVFGISITAGEEIRPGYKDFDELADILEVLEVDEYA